MTDCDVKELQFITINDMIHDSKWIQSIDNMPGNDDDKIDVLLRAIECPKEYHALFDNLINLLQEVIGKGLRRYKVDVRAFGSSVTKLSLKICDLDIHINFDPPLITVDKKFFLTLRKILMQYKKEELFSQIIFIDCKVPILKCFHVIGITCDMSINNRPALSNTALIKFLISLNKSFRPFFLMIKLWIKRQSETIATSFKGYTVALLTIFFLQEKQLLPSVRSLQNHPNGTKLCETDEWCCCFDTNITDNLKNIASQNLIVVHLLREFFQFYSKFEFGLYVISPNRGEKILKPVTNCYKAANEDEQQLKDYYITIQDVFQLNYNPAGQILRQAAMDFQDACQAVSDSWQNDQIQFSQLFSKFKGKPVETNKFFLNVRNIETGANTEGELREKWLCDILEIFQHILVDVALLETVEKAENIFSSCIKNGSIYHKKTRSKVRNEVEKETSPNTETNPKLTAALNTHAKISAAIAKQNELEMPCSIEFTIEYILHSHPTKIEFRTTAVTQFKNLNDLAIWGSFNKNLAQWISQI